MRKREKEMALILFVSLALLFFAQIECHMCLLVFACFFFFFNAGYAARSDIFRNEYYGAMLEKTTRQ